jgi:hypothetical protein
MYERYRFFHENAGRVAIIDENGRPSGIAARVALDLARAEALIDEAEELGIAEVKWPFDDEPYEHGCMTDDEVREQFANNRWTGPFGCVVAIGDDEHAASLWGIVFGSRELDDPYARVVRAELASELVEDLMQAIGDAKDAQLDPLT